MADLEYLRKEPYIERRISSISKYDKRVAVIAAVVELDPEINAAVLDDGTARVQVLLPQNSFSSMSTGQIIRVSGLIAPALVGDNFEIRAELVQDFSGLDPAIFKDFLKNCFF